VADDGDDAVDDYDDCTAPVVDATARVLVRVDIVAVAAADDELLWLETWMMRVNDRHRLVTWFRLIDLPHLWSGRL
jgi:hypothetical protein